jgi:hypothetical protein
MSDDNAYEAPSVEQIDNGDEPIKTAPIQSAQG